VLTKIKNQTNLDDAPISVLESDVTNAATLSALLNKFPWCNTLINCAGVPQAKPLSKVTGTEEATILETNLQAPISLSRSFLSHYLSSRKRRSGIPEADRPPGFTENTAQSYCAVNVSSLLAIKGGIGAVTYSASKAGLIAQTRALALEASRFAAMPGSRSPFRANVILPGYIDTPMTAGFDNDAQKRLKSSIPLHRFGSPEEVADAIVFLITNEYANNCVLNLDGGLSAT
jgi:tRNA-splicing endonuclease subunit Sen54